MTSAVAMENKNGPAMHQCKIRSDLAKRSILLLAGLTLLAA